MTPLDQVCSTIHRHAQALDDGRFDIIESLYVRDASFETPDRKTDGAANIAASLEAAMPPERRGKHLCFNTVAEVRNGVATATTDYVFIGPDRAIKVIGRYYDQLREVDCRWLLVGRRMERM